MRAAPLRALVGSVLLSGVIAGCGSHAGPSRLDPLSQARLRHDLAVLSQAAAARHTAAAGSALATLTADVAAAHAAGRLSDATFEQLQTVIRAVRVDLAPTTPRTTAVPQHPAAPVSTGAATKHGKRDGDGHGKGKGKGHGGD